MSGLQSFGTLAGCYCLPMIGCFAAGALWMKFGSPVRFVWIDRLSQGWGKRSSRDDDDREYTGALRSQ